MRSMSSSLNADKLDREYQRTQQIKKRLMKYVSSEDNKVALKYFVYNLGMRDIWNWIVELENLPETTLKQGALKAK